MVKILETAKQFFNIESKKQMGVGLYVGKESFSLCVIDDLENVEGTTKCYNQKFPATIVSYATDLFTNDRSASYICDYIQKFIPSRLDDVNVVLPEDIASIAVTSVAFAEDEQVQGYARFQASEVFNKNFTAPIFSVCRIENFTGKNNKHEKSKYIVSCAEVQNMITLQKCAVANHINLTTAEPIALCALRAYSDLLQGNVLFVFIDFSHLFLVALVNGKPKNFWMPSLDSEGDGFLAEFSKIITLIIENSYLKQDTLKIKIAGNEMKYKVCEILDRLNIVKEVSLAKCRIDLTSCEGELSFGAALRNL